MFGFLEIEQNPFELNQLREFELIRYNLEKRKYEQFTVLDCIGLKQMTEIMQAAKQNLTEGRDPADFEPDDPIVNTVFR